MFATCTHKSNHRRIVEWADAQRAGGHRAVHPWHAVISDNYRYRSRVRVEAWVRVYKCDVLENFDESAWQRRHRERDINASCSDLRCRKIVSCSIHRQGVTRLDVVRDPHNGTVNRIILRIDDRQGAEVGDRCPEPCLLEEC